MEMPPGNFPLLFHETGLGGSSHSAEAGKTGAQCHRLMEMEKFQIECHCLMETSGVECHFAMEMERWRVECHCLMETSGVEWHRLMEMERWWVECHCLMETFGVEWYCLMEAFGVEWHCLMETSGVEWHCLMETSGVECHCLMETSGVECHCLMETSGVECHCLMEMERWRVECHCQQMLLQKPQWSSVWISPHCCLDHHMQKVEILPALFECYLRLGMWQDPSPDYHKQPRQSWQSYFSPCCDDRTPQGQPHFHSVCRLTRNVRRGWRQLKKKMQEKWMKCR